MPTDSQDQQVAQMLYDDLKAQAKGVANIRGMASGNKKLTPEEEATLYWQKADGWTPDKEIALLASGKSREEVGLLKYPGREKLAKSGGRALSKYEQAKYHATMAKKTDPSWQPPPNKAMEPPLPPGVDPNADPTTTADPPSEAGLSILDAWGG